MRIVVVKTKMNKIKNNKKIIMLYYSIKTLVNREKYD